MNISSETPMAHFHRRRQHILKRVDVPTRLSLLVISMTIVIVGYASMPVLFRVGGNAYEDISFARARQLARAVVAPRETWAVTGTRPDSSRGAIETLTTVTRGVFYDCACHI